MRKSSSFSLPFRDSLHRWNFPGPLSSHAMEHGSPTHRSTRSNVAVWERVRRQAQIKWPLLWLLVSGLCGIWIIAKTSGFHFHPSPTACKVDYDHSVTLTFTPVDPATRGLPPHARYQLFQVHDSLVTPSTLSGRPVLFIPGHAGSARQAKALASHLQLRNPYITDLFAVDFSVEFSAFKGHHLYQQANYVAQCVQAILQLYEHRPLPLRPTSVLLVGHSMGGVVARLAVKKLVSTTYEGEHQSPRLALAEEFSMVETIVTLGTPHVSAAWPIDESVYHIYRDMNLFYSLHKDDLLRHLVMVSLSGGFADTQVQGELSEIPEELFPRARSFFAYTTSLDQVRTDVGHEDLCRCRPLQESLSALITSLSEQTDSSPAARMQTVRQYLADPVPNHLDTCSTTNRTEVMDVVRMSADAPVCRRWMSLPSAVGDVSDWEVIRGLDVQKSSFPLCVEVPKTTRAMEMIVLLSSVSVPHYTLIGLQVDEDNTVKRSEHIPILFLRQSHSSFGKTMTSQSMALLSSDVLQQYDVILISCDVTLIEYVAVHVRPQEGEHVVRMDRSSSSYIARESLFHRFRFPTWNDKHSMVTVRVTRQEESSRASPTGPPTPTLHLIEPLAISSVESVSVCETTVQALSKLGTHDVWTMQFEFHQLSALQSAPSLMIMVDPAERFQITFEVVTNWRQYFRSYARFLLPITLLLPLCTLLYSLARWVDQQVFHNFYLSLSYLLVFWLIPGWTAFFVVSVVSGLFLSEGADDLVLESSSWEVLTQRFDASGLLDEDIILHIPIPLPLSLYYVAIFCASGWILTWTSTPWLVTLALREVVKQVKQQLASESPYHISDGNENAALRYWPLLSLLATLVCIYQPIIALVSATFILFCAIIVHANKDVHVHYQMNVFLLLYMCCVWKFGCLMDVAFQYEGMHPLDREWIVILPIVQLALFSTVWMFPRSLRHGVRYPEWALFGGSICCVYIIIFSWHYVHTTIHAVSVACGLLDVVLLLDWYQRCSHKATKQM